MKNLMSIPVNVKGGKKNQNRAVCNPYNQAFFSNAGMQPNKQIIKYP